MPKLNAAQVEIVNNVTYGASALSLLGSVFVLVVFCTTRSVRRFPFQLVALMALTDVGTMLVNLTPPSSADLAQISVTKVVSTHCKVQATLITFFRLASVLWTCAIASVVFLSTYRRWNLHEVPTKTILVCCAIVYGVSGVLATIPLAFPVYGAAGGWCWVDGSQPDATTWRLVLLYLWVWGGMIFNVAFAVGVRLSLRRLLQAAGVNNTPVAAGGQASTAAPSGAGGTVAGPKPAAAADSASAAFAERVAASVRRMQWYPVILLAVWAFATGNRIYEAIHGSDDQILWLYIAQRGGTSLQGFWNALVYGYSARSAVWARVPPSVRARIWSACGICCCCWCCFSGARGRGDWQLQAAAWLDSGSTGDAEHVLRQGRDNNAAAAGGAGRSRKSRRQSTVDLIADDEGDGDAGRLSRGGRSASARRGSAFGGAPASPLAATASPTSSGSRGRQHHVVVNPLNAAGGGGGGESDAGVQLVALAGTAKDGAGRSDRVALAVGVSSGGVAGRPSMLPGGPSMAAADDGVADDDDDDADGVEVPAPARAARPTALPAAAGVLLTAPATGVTFLSQQDERSRFSVIIDRRTLQGLQAPPAAAAPAATPAGVAPA